MCVFVFPWAPGIVDTLGLLNVLFESALGVGGWRVGVGGGTKGDRERMEVVGWWLGKGERWGGDGEGGGCIDQ